MQAVRVAEAAFQDGIELEPRLRLIEVEGDTAIVQPLVVHPAALHSGEDPLLFDPDSRVQHSNSRRSRHRLSC
ncbi:MAG: hypothetical protein HW404_2486 [Anaerolineales bacterium]|nr:hypothetical protein [Anaerolineales bacterium]